MFTAAKYLLIFSAFFVTGIYGNVKSSEATEPAPVSYIPTWITVTLVLSILLNLILLLGGIYLIWKLKLLCFATKTKESSNYPSKKDQYENLQEIPEVTVIAQSQEPKPDLNKKDAPSSLEEDKNGAKAVQLQVRVAEQNTSLSSEKGQKSSSEKEVQPPSEKPKTLYTNAYGIPNRSPYEVVPLNSLNNKQPESSEKAPKSNSDKDYRTPSEKPKEKVSTRNSELYTDAYGRPNRSPYEICALSKLNDKRPEKPQR